MIREDLIEKGETMKNFRVSPAYGYIMEELEARKKAVMIEFRQAGNDEERFRCQVRLLALEEVPLLINSMVTRGDRERLNQLVEQEEESE